MTQEEEIAQLRAENQALREALGQSQELLKVALARIEEKVSGGTRSPKGSHTRMSLASLFGTSIARHLNPFHQCLAALSTKSSLGQV
jgi:hypothetical protein